MGLRICHSSKEGAAKPAISFEEGIHFFFVILVTGIGFVYLDLKCLSHRPGVERRYWVLCLLGTLLRIPSHTKLYVTELELLC